MQLFQEILTRHLSASGETFAMCEVRLITRNAHGCTDWNLEAMTRQLQFSAEARHQHQYQHQRSPLSALLIIDFEIAASRKTLRYS